MALAAPEPAGAAGRMLAKDKRGDRMAGAALALEMPAGAARLAALLPSDGGCCCCCGLGTKAPKLDSVGLASLPLPPLTTLGDCVDTDDRAVEFSANVGTEAAADDFIRH
mmetsp:Transcript_70569/g.181950  ORF Transcript_70569/g.181950 Transcript_70569/m.181950 type:complete len:110 (-) Transcript_70569:94-423(-)